MSETQYVRARHATKITGHPILKFIAFSAIAVVSFGTVFAQTFVDKIEARITTENIDPLLGPDRPEIVVNPEDGAAGRALNIVLMGSDDRSGENAAIGGVEQGKRNDTTIIMHVSADRQRVELVSIPRDTMVQIENCERSDGTSQRGWHAEFNVAFANGAANGNNADGAACTVKTIEALTNVYIDHFAVIDFVGFRDMVNAVNGVPMCIPVEYADAYSGTYLSPGPQVLNGDQAISYVRMRKGKNVTGSDLDRIDRQQEFLKNLARKVLSAEMLYRPQEVTNFIKAVADSLTVDEKLGDVNYLGGLAFSLRHLDPGNGIVMATAPVETYPADHNRVQFSRKAPAIWEALRNDQPIAPLLDQQSASPANEVGVSDSTAGGSTDAGGANGEGGSSSVDIDQHSEQAILDACPAA